MAMVQKAAQYNAEGVIDKCLQVKIKKTRKILRIFSDICEKFQSLSGIWC
jgi:hypothetical protein